MGKKTTLLLLALFILSTFAKIHAQGQMFSYASEEFNETTISKILAESRKKGTPEWEVEVLKQHLYKRLKNKQQQTSYRENAPISTMAANGPCTNIGFDNGSTSGWTLTSGNINGVTLPCNTCATTAGGIATITTASNSGTTWSAGVDGCSGQNVLAPVAGNVNSVCLNDNTTGGKMQEIQQTFLVSASNNIFTYEYLAVLQDGGHAATDQPYFFSQVSDASGNPIPCTKVLQSASGTIPGWINSTSCLSTSYKGWVTVTLDLTSYMGQNVTIQFLVSDCNQGGHYGYCYIDAQCDQEATTNTVTICPGSTQLCGQAGFATYTWSGPVTGNTQCLNTSTPGSYTLTATGQCPAPTRYYTVTVSPTPTVNFTYSVTPCNNTVPFTDQSTITGATIAGWSWNFGETSSSSNTSTLQNPSHTYAGAGTYNVVLTCTSSVGCTGTYSTTVTISAGPTATFSATTVCPGNPTAFTTTSPGTSYSWNFGEPSSGAANTSTVQNPTHTYAASGSYVATLSVSGTGTCVAVATQTVVVSSAPTLSFTASHPCEGTAMTFTNNTANQPTFSTWVWDFGDGGATGSGATPAAHSYAAAGCYTVVLTGTTTAGCTGTYSTTVYDHPNPGISFTAFEVCLGDSAEFVDSSYVVNPSCLNDNITSWSWNFGDGTGAHVMTTMPDTLKYNYAACGPYNITLIVTTSNTCTNTATLTGDTIYCPPIVTAPLDFTVCPGANTPVQTFNTVCSNGGTPTTIWFQSLGNVNNTGAPASFINPGGVGQQVPSYAAIAQNLSCNLLTDSVFAVAISGFGCVGNAVFYTENVSPTPVLNHMDSIDVCSNGQAVVPPFTVCPAGSTIAWTNNTPSIGLAASGTGNVTSPFTGLNSTPQAVYALITATPSINGCVGPDSTFIIAVSPLPTMTVTNLPPYCPGDAIPSPTINSALGAVFAWTVSNAANIGMAASGTGIPAPYTAPANTSLINQVGIITFTPTLNGCVGTPANDTITIKPTPTMQPMTDQFWCPSQNTNAVTFATNPAPAGAVTTYTWSYTTPLSPLPSTGTTNPFASLPTLNPGQTTLVVAVTVTPTLNGCVGPPSGFNISVYPSPTASFTYTPVCEGQAMSFTDLSTPNSGNITVNQWAWDMNNDGIFNDATTQNPSYSITPAGQDPISLFVSTSSVPSCTAVVTETVTVYPNPVPDFVGDTLSGCPILNVTFSDASTIAAPSAITSYAWNFGTGAIPSSATASSGVSQGPISYNNTSATAIKSYTVSLTVTATGGCTATKTKAGYINVSPTPKADFSWGPTDADIDDPTITFVNQAIGAGPYVPVTYGPYGVHYYLGDIYAYNQNSNNVDNNTSFTHVYDYYQPETYTVTQWVINSLGCKDSIKKEVIIQPNFTFYIPNAFSPNGDGTNEGFKGTGVGIQDGTYNLWVFDRWGNMIFYSDDLEKAWDGHMKGNEDRPVLQEDVYVWKVNFHDFKGKKHDFHGTVTLLK